MSLGTEKESCPVFLLGLSRVDTRDSIRKYFIKNIGCGITLLGTTKTFQQIQGINEGRSITVSLRFHP